MGRYEYNQLEKERNKVLKYQQDMLLQQNLQMEAIQRSCDQHIAESEKLLKSLGYEIRPVQAAPDVARKQTAVPVITESWEDIVRQAEERYPYDVVLEDLLSQTEFENAYRDLNNINLTFKQCTALDGIDITLLTVAAALQTLRWVLMPEIGKTIDKAARISADEGDKQVQKLKKAFVEKHKNWTAEKQNQGHRLREQEGKTWKEIVFSGVPYDVIKGSKDVLQVGLSGKTHRYRTLGHDPILGWIFGTANILTNTLTLNTLMSYRVENGSMTKQMLMLPQLFSETLRQIESDRCKLPAAVFRQALHYRSDMNTKHGLPVPLLGIFNEALAGKLYANQYDFLCFLRDCKIETASTVLSVMINMVIGLIHGLYYDELHDGERALFELRTRKILMYSNTLASSGNVAATLITKNGKMLDIGGLIVTISRLYTDARFIARAKENFIQKHLDNQWKQITTTADELLYAF